MFDDVDVLVDYDTSEDFGEDRMIATGDVNGLIITVVYVERGERIRIISARKATNYEQRAYGRGKAS